MKVYMSFPLHEFTIVTMTVTNYDYDNKNRN